MPRLARTLVPLLIVALAAPLVAQETPRTGEATEVFLLRQDGAFEGVVRAERGGDLQVATALGLRVVRAADVEERSDAAPLRARYERRLQELEKPDDVEARLELARWCELSGLTSGVASELAAVLERAPEDVGAWSVIRRLAPQYRPARRNPTPPDRNRWGRKEADLLFAGLRDAEVATAAILVARLASLPPDITVGEAIDLSKRGRVLERWAGARLLRLSPETRRVKPLYERALNDPSWQVRAAAVESLRVRDDGTTIGPFLKALYAAERDSARVHAAEALGLLGDARATPHLIRALAEVGDGRPARSNVAFIDQLAYVKDYDVEIAQSAVIADPIIDVAQSGVVLDAGVVAVTTQRAVIAGSLARLTGRDLGVDAAAWRAWWKERESD